MIALNPTAKPEIADDPLWYKDAVIYQLHIKAFFDSNKDGMGDFQGLTSKLDYLEWLGVNTLWLLPFYPSPLRDDGYDIADYCDVHPSYGTMEDFRRFVEEAHARGLRVITELVINHTSDQHPWFQRARKAPPGSSHRNFYTWSDTEQKYQGTRIIFTDTETSNWAWDPEAKAYYWHRFFSHQPDLNFDNPDVLEEVLKAMYFWLDAGVDGLRLDAIPYLCQREGTTNENLPETHAIIKRIRSALDARYANRLLLAEANQWPEDVKDYFGDGDECHMAFHFPLMPRIYMAVAQEDRHPITDIMYQTPDIPPNCQWAIFLRNHDELTLEMVTDRERDYLWDFYAADKRARINLGIRRRLAPLMDNDRRKVELLNSLLLSMPGTPIIYYGDELGMGDNIYLGDRNGVRTPMQWSPDRNGGFSFADPAQLYLPAIMDPIYGFQSINVESQMRVQNSLLNWMRNLLTITKSTPVFGRGTLKFLAPSNRKVLAYIREFDNQRIVCAANLSRSSQAVELDLRDYKDYVPLEMLGQSVFPTIGELPYLLTLPPYGFFWFLLTEKKEKPAAVNAPDLLTLVLSRSDAGEFLSGNIKSVAQQQLFPSFLLKQRWYKGKHAALNEAVITYDFALTPDQHVLVLNTSPDEEHPRYYVLCLGISWESKNYDPLEQLSTSALSRVRYGNKAGLLYESSAHAPFVTSFMEALNASRVYTRQSAGLVFRRHTSEQNATEETAIKLLSADQSNTSLSINDSEMLKIIRQPEPGINPEEEMGHFLTEISSFDRTPGLLGSVRIENPGKEPITVALLQKFVRNQGDGWHMTLDYLGRIITDTEWLTVPHSEAHSQFGYYVPLATQLGRRSAELHNALSCLSGNPAFEPEAVTEADRKAWMDMALQIARLAAQNMQAALPRLPKAVLPLAQQFLEQTTLCETQIKTLLPATIKTPKIRVHGDYHLGQVLVAENDFYIVDFEGEPARSLTERRSKTSPFKDVAGMLRSFDYAAASIIRNNPPLVDNVERMELFLRVWRNVASKAFLAGYNEVRQAYDSPDVQMATIRFFMLTKALYEIVYESQQRPDWLDIPIQGVLTLLQGEAV